MSPQLGPLSILSLACLAGCPLPPELVTCEEAGACATTDPTSTGDHGPPTTGDGVHTVTGDSADATSDASTGTTAPMDETGDTTGGTTDEPALPPQIVDGVVIPDFIAVNGLLTVEVTTLHTEGVTMFLGKGQPGELSPLGAGKFVGQIQAFSGYDNGKHTAILTPRRDNLVGAPVAADYVIQLKDPGSQINWDSKSLVGEVVAIDVLPDGRPVELGTYFEMGAPRCYLRVRDKQGEQVKPAGFVPLLGSAHCRAIDLKIDRVTGRLDVLVERKIGEDPVWWAGQISAWGKGMLKIGVGVVGDKAHALASRPDVVAVCGSRVVDVPNATDKLDALAVLLRPGEPAEARVFDYNLTNDPNKAHQFTETARDCAFAGDTLVLVGEAWGRHEAAENNLKFRDRLMLIESDLAAAVDDATWTVAGFDQGVQTRALALDLDDKGCYILAGSSCSDICDPVGEVRVYAPGGKLAAPTFSLGPLGSTEFGPHDIAWSPAGYAVVAMGGLDHQTIVFKVQAVTPGDPTPRWTFIPNDKLGPQMAFAVAVGEYGEVYAGGVGSVDQAAFACIAS